MSAQFGAASSGGISSLGVNLKSFVFQLITFLIVLGILGRWVFPKLITTLEARRKTLEQSLTAAKATQATLQKAEAEAAQILNKARAQADQALSDARAQAKDLMSKAEADAQAQAQRILDENDAKLQNTQAQIRSKLRDELAGLVSKAAEKVLRTKIDNKKDAELIAAAIKEL